MPESHTKIYRRRPDGSMEEVSSQTSQVTAEERELEEIEERLRKLYRIRRNRAWTAAEKDRILRLLLRDRLRE